jgi:hypothetical protein
MNTRCILSRSLAGAICACAPVWAEAGGSIAELVSVVVPAVGSAGKALGDVFVQTSAPLLQGFIARSRDDALRHGAQAIPPEIRRDLSGFFPDHVLDVVRFRVRGGDDLSLQVSSIRHASAQAITLDYVIVFKDVVDALNNRALWAHELTHVDQYQRWGIRAFAVQYLRDYRSVETEAEGVETRYAAWAALRKAQP